MSSAEIFGEELILSLKITLYSESIWRNVHNTPFHHSSSLGNLGRWNIIIIVGFQYPRRPCSLFGRWHTGRWRRNGCDSLTGTCTILLPVRLCVWLQTCRPLCQHLYLRHWKVMVCSGIIAGNVARRWISISQHAPFNVFKTCERYIHYHIYACGG